MFYEQALYERGTKTVKARFYKQCFSNVGSTFSEQVSSVQQIELKYISLGCYAKWAQLQINSPAKISIFNPRMLIETFKKIIIENFVSFYWVIYRFNAVFEKKMSFETIYKHIQKWMIIFKLKLNIPILLYSQTF